MRRRLRQKRIIYPAGNEPANWRNREKFGQKKWEELDKEMKTKLRESGTSTTSNRYHEVNPGKDCRL